MNTVRDNPQTNRHDLCDGEKLAGFSEDKLATGEIAFTHTTGLDPSLEGRGVDGRPVRDALDHVRTLGVPGLPICPFVQAWTACHLGFLPLRGRRPTTRMGD